MARIAAVVLNTVARDGRVLKQADSLAEAGHDVTVYGIRDANTTESEWTRRSGARIVLVDWVAASYARLARDVKLATVASGAALLLITALGVAVTWSATDSASIPLALAAVGLAVAATVADVGWGIGTSFSQAAINPRAAMPSSRVRRAVRRVVHRLRRVVRRGRAHVRRRRGLVASNWVPWAVRRVVRRLRQAVRRVVQRLRRVVRRGRAHVRQRRKLLVSKLSARTRTSIAKRFLLRKRLQVLADAVATGNPDVVHCHDLPTVPVGTRVKRRAGSLLVYDAHEIFEEVSLITQAERRRYSRRQRQTAPHVDGFVTVNDEIERYLREKYGFPRGMVIRNAVLPATLPPVDDGRLRERAEVPADRRILLYQGGFARFRGLDALVAAAPLLPEDWILVMMGWGRHEEQLTRLADEVDAERRRLRFIPGAPYTELRSWTAGADLGVIPYENVCLNHWYCSPNKLWEYPIAGVPILASPFPVMESIISEHGIGTFLDSPPTAEGIAGAVASITPERLAAMTAATLSFVARDNWSVYAERLLHLYEELTGSGHPVATREMAGATSR